MGWHKLSPDTHVGSSLRSGHEVRMSNKDISLVANDILMDMGNAPAQLINTQRRGGREEGLASEGTVGGTGNTQTDLPPPPPHQQLVSSWHDSEDEFLSECGNMKDVLDKMNGEFADRKPVVWRCGCTHSGLGDRLKGIVAAMMLAMVLKRPFACEVFPSMAELEYGVEPSLHDWRSNYFNYVNASPWNKEKTKVRPVWSNRAASGMTNGGALDYTRGVEVTQTTPAKIPLLQRFISEVMGEDASILSTEPYVGDGKEFTSDDATNITHPFREVIAHAHYCATRAMFRPTAKMRDLLDVSLAPPVAEGHEATAPAAASNAVAGPDSAILKPEPFIIGMHSRFGGKWKDRKRARDSDVEQVIECAWNLTLAYKANPLPGGASQPVVWILTSDNVERLEAIVEGFADSVGKSKWKEQNIRNIAIKDVGIVEHVVKSVNGSEVEATKRLWLDWFLMTEVHSCSLIRSSFPRTACYTSRRRNAAKGLVQQYVTNWDLGRYPRVHPVCNAWSLKYAPEEGAKHPTM